MQLAAEPLAEEHLLSGLLWLSASHKEALYEAYLRSASRWIRGYGAHVQAAEARAANDLALAKRLIKDIIRMRPEHARALFALGQLHAASRQWQAAEKAYNGAAECEADNGQRARCHFGAGQGPRQLVLEPVPLAPSCGFAVIMQCYPSQPAVASARALSRSQSSSIAHPATLFVAGEGP